MFLYFLRIWKEKKKIIFLVSCTLLAGYVAPTFLIEDVSSTCLTTTRLITFSYVIFLN